MEAPICPVCGEALKVTGANPNVYACTKRKVWLSDLGLHCEIIDATVYVDLQTGKRTSKLIEIPPYVFWITDDGSTQKTDVRKLVLEERIPGIKQGSRSFERKRVLSLNCAMKLPWNDKEKVMERMRLYLLFS